MKNWTKSEVNDNSMVLSSRIRLARNLKNIPFPDRLTEEKGREVIKKIEEAFYTSMESEEKYRSIYLWETGGLLNKSFLERHLISKKLINNFKKSAFILNDSETVSIMLNEEDHIRLQCITGGLDLKSAYEKANYLDDIIEDKLDLSFSENLGYLTACPTNIGTGLRASVMIHLPALSINNEINGIFNAISQLGMTIRGLYGEGSKAEGHLYQLSNQVTLGLTEDEIINNLNAVVSQIINQENATREQMITKYKYEIEDKIYRSLGILKSAVILNSKECLDLLSNVRLGVEMGIIKNIDMVTLNSLLVETNPATLEWNSRVKLSGRERDLKRAELVKKKISKGGEI